MIWILCIMIFVASNRAIWHLASRARISSLILFTNFTRGTLILKILLIRRIKLMDTWRDILWGNLSFPFFGDARELYYWFFIVHDSLCHISLVLHVNYNFVCWRHIIFKSLVAINLLETHAIKPAAVRNRITACILTYVNGYEQVIFQDEGERILFVLNDSIANLF